MEQQNGLQLHSNHTLQLSAARLRDAYRQRHSENRKWVYDGCSSLRTGQPCLERWSVINLVSEYCAFADYHAGYNSLCVPALQPFGDYPGRSCLNVGFIGAPFFLENFAVFNQAEPSVSYAPYA